MASRHWLRPLGAALLLTAAVPSWSPQSPQPARAVEISGASYFLRAPWKADLISYQTTMGEAPVWYYLTLSLDADAGAPLTRLTVEQTRGVDRSFGFNIAETTAFLGRPRQTGPSLPVRASFDSAARLIGIDFPEPVQPGQTVTVVLRLWTNPMQSDTYMFAVVAWPAKYGNSGIMTFIVNQDGKVYQADLGPGTAKRASAMQRFDPDAGWTPVTPK